MFDQFAASFIWDVLQIKKKKTTKRVREEYILTGSDSSMLRDDTMKIDMKIGGDVD